MTDTRSKNWKQKKIGTHICVFGTAPLNFLSSEVYRCVRVYEAIFFQITQMLWSKDDHSSHTFKEEALLKIIFVYAFRKNNIWHKVLRTILLHMSFAFSWSGPDCRPYFCGKAVKGQEEGATLIVARRLNWTSWSSLTFHLQQYTAICIPTDSFASLFWRIHS